jgi:hypothetical protein
LICIKTDLRATLDDIHVWHLIATTWPEDVNREEKSIARRQY